METFAIGGVFFGGVFVFPNADWIAVFRGNGFLHVQADWKSVRAAFITFFYFMYAVFTLRPCTEFFIMSPMNDYTAFKQQTASPLFMQEAADILPPPIANSL